MARKKKSPFPQAITTVSISQFKARCLGLIDQVKRTGQPILVTRRGEPMATVCPPEPAEPEASWLGSAATTGRITGNLVDPLASSDWEVLDS